jgi:hypothetical protein
MTVEGRTPTAATWRTRMAEYGEWHRKGAVLSDVTAEKEYGLSRSFVMEGIHNGKLEFRYGVIHGNPYYRVLRRQLEKYITEKLGAAYVTGAKARTELRSINKEMAEVKKKLTALQDRKLLLQASLKPNPKGLG